MFAFPEKLSQIFAFEHYKACVSFYLELPVLSQRYWNFYDARKDFERMGLFDGENLEKYALTDLNGAYKLCTTYPALLVFPKKMTPAEIFAVAKYRSKGRLPTLCWKHPRNKSSLWRCAQPRSGVSTARCFEDEKLFSLLSELNEDNPLVYIVDCRPRINAMGNKLTGAGYESLEHYSSCDISFMNIQNIHAMRESYTKLSKAFRSTSHQSFYSMVDLSGWLVHISEILRSTLQMVHKMDSENSTIVSHCSDGWDRTAQLVSLSELCLDPHYRTLEGFFHLIQKEWLNFGHKFHQRTGICDRNIADDQRSPIFMQWIEAVWNLTEQFPTCFEFSSTLLVELIDQIYGCRFGTFLCNSVCEREAKSLHLNTFSIWQYFLNHKNRIQYLNPFFEPNSTNVIYPSFSVREICIWKEFWLRWVHLDLVAYPDVELKLSLAPHITYSSLSDPRSLILKAHRRLLERIDDLEKKNQMLNEENDKYVALKAAEELKQETCSEEPTCTIASEEKSIVAEEKVASDEILSRILKGDFSRMTDVNRVRLAFSEDVLPSTDLDKPD
jgi:hypothetical protein